jgi:hypothetical protein
MASLDTLKVWADRLGIRASKPTRFCSGSGISKLDTVARSSYGEVFRF